MPQPKRTLKNAQRGLKETEIRFIDVGSGLDRPCQVDLACLDAAGPGLAGSGCWWCQVTWFSDLNGVQVGEVLAECGA